MTEPNPSHWPHSPARPRPRSRHTLRARTAPCNVLFLCTDNAARSLMAEVLLEHWGRERFHAFSAGSQPTAPDPLTVKVITRAHLLGENLQARSWTEYAQPGALPMDFVITLCPLVAAETPPEWPGNPVTAHWGILDPTQAVGDGPARQRAFERAYREIESRIKLFVSLPFASLDRLTLGVEVGRLE